jgi:hypothetical protein
VVVVEFIGAIGGGGGGVVVVCSVVVVVWETGGGGEEHPARRTVPAKSATPRARLKGDVVTIIVWLQKIAVRVVFTETASIAVGRFGCRAGNRSDRGRQPEARSRLDDRSAS